MQLPALAATPISQNEITIIGDSLTVRATSSLHEQIPNAVVDAAVSRPWSGGLSALDNLKKSGKLYSTLVFALGTNNASLTSSDIDSLLTAAQGSKIILVTIYNSTHPDWANNVNGAIKAAAVAHPDLIKIADWNAAVAANPALIDNSDGLGVHPTIPEGSLKFTDTILSITSVGVQDNPGLVSKTAKSNCIITKVGTPPQANLFKPPASCGVSKNGGSIPGSDQAALLGQIKGFVDQGKIRFEQSNDLKGMTDGSGQVLRDDGTLIAISTQVLRFYVYMVGQGYTFSVSSMVGHHDKYSSSGYVSRHWDGFALDIDYINGQSIDDSGTREVTVKFMKTLNSLIDKDLAPSQLLCAGNGSIDPGVDALSMDKGKVFAGFTTMYVGDHTNHVHVGY